MTETLRRFYGGHDLHSLTFSCYQRQPLFSEPARRDLFLKTLERVRRRYRLVVVGYVVMPEHVHLLVSEPQRASLSTAMQALKLGLARSLQISSAEGYTSSKQQRNNLRDDCRTLKVGCPMSRRICETWDYDGLRVSPRRAKKSNPFWMPRFYDFNVWTEKKRIEKLRYIHRNPVARGLVASPEQWPWTSFRWYSSGEVGPVKINDTDILVMTIHPPAA
jgi:putative transposase